MTTMKSYLQRLDEIPPPLCRLIARTKSRAPRILTIPEIAAASGLRWQKVAWISRQRSFARITVEDADQFRAGCGITRANEKHHREYIMRNLKRKGGFDHLLKTVKRHDWSPQWQERFRRRVLKRL